MSDTTPADREARLQAEVDRAVARYVGKVPPFVLAKLRELAERYWREQPEAVRTLQVVTRGQPMRSGDVATSCPDDLGSDAVGEEKV